MAGGRFLYRSQESRVFVDGARARRRTPWSEERCGRDIWGSRSGGRAAVSDSRSIGIPSASLLLFDDSAHDNGRALTLCPLLVLVVLVDVGFIDDLLRDNLFDDV